MGMGEGVQYKGNLAEEGSEGRFRFLAPCSSLQHAAEADGALQGNTPVPATAKGKEARQVGGKRLPSRLHLCPFLTHSF